MTAPADNFTQIDQAIIEFKNEETALFWKVNAMNRLFETSRTIITNNYHVELQRIVMPLCGRATQRRAFKATIQVVETLHKYSQEALFFQETFDELLNTLREQSLQGNTAASLDAIINKDEQLMHLFGLLNTPTTLMKKYPFKSMIALGKRFRKGNPLFLANIDPGISVTDHVIRLL